MVRFLKAWLPVAGMCVVIFLLSQDAGSGRHSDRVLGWLLDMVGMNTVHLRHLLDPGFRKFAHVFVYFCLAGLTYRGWAMGRREWQWSAAVRSLIFCAVYAATDEYHQSFVYGRGPSVRDVGIDTLGATLCLLLVWLWMRGRTLDDSGNGNRRHIGGVNMVESA